MIADDFPRVDPHFVAFLMRTTTIRKVFGLRRRRALRQLLDARRAQREET